jgi:hypothetical protein
MSYEKGLDEYSSTYFIWYTTCLPYQNICFLHIMTRLNPFGRGRTYEIINVLVDTFYLICNMPTLSDLRIFHWLTPPRPWRVPKVDRDFLLFNIPACPALYYVTMFSSSFRSHGAFRALYPAPPFIGDIASELSVFNQF